MPEMPENPGIRPPNSEKMDPQEKKEILDAIANSHQVAYNAFQTLFENSIKGFSDQLGQFEERNNKQHHEIIDHQEDTNGRVASLETETRIFRWMTKNPKASGVIIILLLAGVIALGVFLGIDNLIKII